MFYANLMQNWNKTDFIFFFISVHVFPLVGCYVQFWDIGNVPPQPLKSLKCGPTGLLILIDRPVIYSS